MSGNNQLNSENSQFNRVLRQIIKHPFRFYIRAGSFTFGLTFLANFLTSWCDSQTRTNMLEHSQIFTVALLGKSLWFGTVWPSFYITTMFDPSKTLLMRGPNIESFTAKINIRNKNKDL